MDESDEKMASVDQSLLKKMDRGHVTPLYRFDFPSKTRAFG